MAEGDIRRIFERLDQMGQEITRLVVLGEAKNRQCDQQEKTIADHEERITNLECQIGFYPETADNTAGMRLSNQAEAISTDYSVFSLQNNHNINYANNAALQVGSFKFLEIDKTTKDLAIMAETGGK